MSETALTTDADEAQPRPWDVRADLVRRVFADLHGPLDGEHEVIRGYQREDRRWPRPGRVRDRYMVGMLAPRGPLPATLSVTTMPVPRRATRPAEPRTSGHRGWCWPSRRLGGRSGRPAADRGLLRRGGRRLR